MAQYCVGPVIVDLLMYWLEYRYYESRGLLILFTLAQIVVMAVIILILQFIDATITT